MISIIAILAGLLVPSFTTAQATTRQALCQTRLRSIGAFHETYHSRTGRYLCSTNSTASLQWGIGCWHRVYAEERRDAPYTGGSAYLDLIKECSDLWCPDSPPGTCTGTSISPNYKLNLPPTSDSVPDEMYANMYRSFEPEQVIIAGDTNFYGLADEGNLGSDFALPMFRHMCSAPPNEKRSGSGSPASRGDGYAQFVFGDGHVAKYKPDEYADAKTNDKITLAWD